jgi:iron complex transport system substrate-binding protein
MKPGRHRGLALAALLAAAALAPTAVAAGAAAAAAPAAAAELAIVDDRGVRVALAQPPQRIVSMLPSLTETVCVLGACERLVGTDRHSNWPASVAALPKLGGLEDAQVERIVRLKPNLVVAARSMRLVDRLEALGLTVATLEPRTLADTRRVMGALATLLGTPAAGSEAWRRMEGRLEAAARRVPAGWRGQRVYFEVASVPYAAGEASYVGETLARMGLRNVVPAALGPFPPLSAEFVLRAQPDVVMASARELAAMPSRPGWRGLRALAERRSCGFEAAAWDTLMRPGPRLADGAEAIAACLQGLPAPDAR